MPKRLAVLPLVGSLVLSCGLAAGPSAEPATASAATSAPVSTPGTVAGSSAAPAAAGLPVARAETGLRSYFVLTAPQRTAAVSPAVIGQGGRIYAAYDAIGVLVVHSTVEGFADRVRRLPGVQRVGATRTSDVPAESAAPPVPASPAQTPDRSPEISRADMQQIGAERAWPVNPGSPRITVGVLDTGVDDQHADLRANFDTSRSASCAYGRLDTRPGAWRPVGEHGTHVAGTIAAARNGAGMVGVAPGVRISSIRVAEAGSQLFFPENTVCAFVFAADRGVSVTNNSYYVDPWLFTCPDDADQAAIAEAVGRAVAYADARNVVNVAAAGNEDYDLAAKSGDDTSPNDSQPAQRTVGNDCLSLPNELPDVVVAASVGPDGGKSAFSNYGTGKISVAAPGEDVYSTVPGGGYQSLDGTSMASPHVAGVAALLRSVDPRLTPQQVRDRLATQANDVACPETSAGECTGTTQNNSYYGEGLVDAAEAAGAGTASRSGVTVTVPAPQLGVGGLPAVPVRITGRSNRGNVTYTATGLPPGLRIDPRTGWITGVLQRTTGQYRATITARDPQGRSAATPFTWSIWSF